MDLMQIKSSATTPRIVSLRTISPPHLVAHPFKKDICQFLADHANFKKLFGSFHPASSNRFVGSTITCFFASSLIPYRGSDLFAGGLITFPSKLNNDPCFSHFNCPAFSAS